MINFIENKIKNIQYLEEKKRFLLFVVLLFSCLFFAVFLLQKAYASYESYARLSADIDQALYILDAEELSFSLEPSKIVPSDDPYVYKFSVSNFDGEDSSEVDLIYKLDVRTTTNLPITVELYRNENYGDSGITNLLGPAQLKQDVDGAWYRTYIPGETYTMEFKNRITDIYTLVVNFPKIYSEDTTYADSIENIEITIESSQII